MGHTLLILEVSRKQDYIFSSKRLRENAARSEDISRVTGSAFFREIVGSRFSEAENLVYSGGGHTVLQFESREAAVDFARAVTSAAMRRYRGLELFAKQIPYDPEKNRTGIQSLLDSLSPEAAASLGKQIRQVQEDMQ